MIFYWLLQLNFLKTQNRLSKWRLAFASFFSSFRMFSKYEPKCQHEITDEESCHLMNTSESCRLLDAAVKVNDLLNDVESRAIALDAKSDYFRSVASHIGQLSDVISHLLCLNQRLAWFLWRSIASVIRELMEHILTLDVSNPGATTNERTLFFSTLPVSWQQWQFVNSRIKGDDALENQGKHLVESFNSCL